MIHSQFIRNAKAIPFPLQMAAYIYILYEWPSVRNGHFNALFGFVLFPNFIFSNITLPICGGHCRMPSITIPFELQSVREETFGQPTANCSDGLA